MKDKKFELKNSSVFISKTQQQYSEKEKKLKSGFHALSKSPSTQGTSEVICMYERRTYTYNEK